MSPANSFNMALVMFVAAVVFATARAVKGRKATPGVVLPTSAPSDAEALLRAAYAAVENEGVKMAIKDILADYAAKHASDFKAKMQAMTAPKEPSPPA